MRAFYALFFSWTILISSLCATQPKKPSSESIIKQVKAIAEKGENEEKKAICALLDELVHSSCVLQEGSDADQRPVFVGVQADFERLFLQLLSTKQINHLTCIIHTPAPATPLCTNGEISPGLVDPSLLNDSKRLLTVTQRPELLRTILKMGGDIFTAYPRGGRHNRSSEQLAILDDLLNDHPEHLVAVELNCTELPQDLIGATYIISLDEQQTFALSIKSYQAIQPTGRQWGIWFGTIKDPVIADRLQTISTFLGKHGCSIDPLISFCEPNPSVKAYFEAFPTLRSNMQWAQIIELGERALQNSPRSNDAIQIHGQLASTYFYQGNFEQADKHATLCYNIASVVGNQQGQVHGLYLLSATARAREDFAKAKSYALQALPKSEGELRAKVLFNLGATEEEDPRGNLEQARASLEEALSLFHCSEDQQRTTIRLGKIYFLTKRLDTARNLLENVLPEIQNIRIIMHAEYLLAQIEKASGNIDKARVYAMSALAKANQLGASKDAERIENFCNDKQPPSK